MNTGAQATSTTGRVVATVLRPFFIFFDVTLLGYVLLRLYPSDRSEDLPALSASRAGGDGYFDWLGSFLPLDSAMTDALEITAQLVVAACLVALVMGAALGAISRSGIGARVVGNLSIPMLSFAGPMLGITLSYWFALRFQLAPAFGGTSFGDNPADAIEQLILPALAVGLPMAPAVGTIMGRRDPYAEPYGIAAAGTLLASRSESRPGWRFGLPAGLLVAGVMTTELIFSRPGLADRLFEGLVRSDLSVTLDVLGLLALGGAAMALIIDLIGLRPHYPTAQTTAGLRLAGYSTKPPSLFRLSAASALIVGLVAFAAWGSSRGEPEPDIAARLEGPFSAGHLAGTDDLGRDLLQMAASGVGPGIVFALVPSFVAIVLAIGLAAAQDRLGSVGQIVPGTVIDALWWPLPVLAMIAALAFSGTQDRFLHPAVLGLMALGLLPTALRMLRRDPLLFDGGGLIRMVGTWLMAASTCFLAYLVASFAVGTGSSSLGPQMGAGFRTLPLSAWPAAVPATVALLMLFVLNSLGAALIHLGWHRSAQSLTDALDAEAEEVPILLPNQPPLRDDDAWGHADGGHQNEGQPDDGWHDDDWHEEPAFVDGEEIEEMEVSVSAAGGPVAEVDRSRLGPWLYAADYEDGPLAPNYGLQPGMPQVDPNDDTVSMDELPMIPPPPLSAEQRSADESSS